MNSLSIIGLPSFKWLKIAEERVKYSDIISPRQGHASAMYNHKLYIFGGEDAKGSQDDMYSLDMKTFTWYKVN